MTWLRRLWSLTRRARLQREIDDEFAFHLEMSANAHRATGADDATAKRLAGAAFGHRASLNERTRDMDILRWAESLLQDVAYAFRQWRQTPVVAIVAIATIALAIGLNTALFTVLHAVLLREPPFPDPQALVEIWEESPQRPGQPWVVSPTNFDRWQTSAVSFASLAAFLDGQANLTGTDAPEEVTTQAVTADFFTTLRVQPSIGRSFSTAEQNDPWSAVVILSHELWQRRFGGDRRVIGRTIRFNARTTTVVGIMPPGFGQYLGAKGFSGPRAAVWIPYTPPSSVRQIFAGRGLTVIARLKDGISVEHARAEIDQLRTQLTQDFPERMTGWQVRVRALQTEQAAPYRDALLLLFGAVLCVLLVAGANLGGLLIARGTSREREFAIRRAIGGGRGRLARQLLTEALVLGIIGGAAGLLIARWSLNLLGAVSSAEPLHVTSLRLNLPVLMFTAAVSVITATLAGVVPALQSGRTTLEHALRRTVVPAGPHPEQRRLLNLLVIGEVALAVTLLTGAALLIRDIQQLRRVDPGFPVNGLLTLRLQVPRATYPSESQRTRFFQAIEARAAQLPGVQEVGAVSFAPFSGSKARTSFSVEGEPPAANGALESVDVIVCDNGYFRALNLPIIRGRAFSEPELRDRSNVVIINEAFARWHWPDRDPIGQRVVLSFQPGVPTVVIGIVKDFHQMTLATPATPTAFWPHAQMAYPAMTVVVRTAGQVAGLGTSLERIVHALDHDQPVSEIRTMDESIAETTTDARMHVLLMTTFGVLALVLAAIGIYGIMSYRAHQREPELGIRLALGANRVRVFGLVVREGAWLTGVGLAGGIGLALISSRAWSRIMFQAADLDWRVLAMVTSALAVASAIATIGPARRATRMRPGFGSRGQ